MEEFKFEGLAQAEKDDRKDCKACNGTGWFKSGVCHCGEHMYNHSLYDNHSPVEMEGECPYCEVKTK